MSPSFIEVLISLAVALGAGLLVGAERERADGVTFAGVRTFPLYSLAGAVGGLLGVWVLAAMAIAVGALVSVANFRHRQEPEHEGMSTEVAILVTFGLGALSTADRIALALSERLLLVAAGATATLALLSLKEPLHGFTARISKPELYATTKLLLLAVILVPLLPNQDLGPWGTLNPRAIGLLVLLISAIAFVGYIAIRVLGVRRGVGLTGLLGGLASSTAVTLTFSGRAAQDRSSEPAAAVAIVLASAVMFPRILVEVYAVSPDLAWKALLPFLTAGFSGLAAGAVLYQQASSDQTAGAQVSELELQNPFSLSSAFKFAALFVVVLLVSGAAAHRFQDAGVYVSATLTGLADADSMALTLAQMHRLGRIDQSLAVNGIGLAALTNTASKAAIAAVIGGAGLAGRVTAALFVAISCGLIVHLLLV